MGKIVAGIFGFLFLVGLFLVYASTHKIDDTKAVRAYVESRGAAPVPRSWKYRIGQGI